ncbi:MAG: GNAT family N-acetyltransferase [Candidatus Kapaibacterium sp.]
MHEPIPISVALLHVVKLRPAAAEQVHRIHYDCAADLQERFGAGHWGISPSLKQLQQLAAVKSLFAVRMSTQTIATFTLALIPPSFFDVEMFHNPADPAAYLTGLAVMPGLQRQGIGGWCMEQVESIAMEWGCAALRFDVFDSPAGAAPFYHKLGYSPRGTMVFNRVPLILFEKILTA